MSAESAESSIERRDEPHSGAPFNALTGRQQMLLSAIETYYRATGEACPGAWLGRRFSLHHSTVQKHIIVLHRKGWLRSPNPPAVPRRRGE